jgi:thiol-disulfide isomerase/thioredoxin
MRRSSVTATLVLIAGLGLTACTTPASTGAGATPTPTHLAEEMTEEMATSEPMDDMSADAMAAGAYLSLEEYQNQMAERADTTVVYFFHADWCPSCRATDESLTTAGIPDGLTVVKVDYDTANDLKREYGITQQHTFVQVDRDGTQLAKWTGSVTGEDIKAQAIQG